MARPTVPELRRVAGGSLWELILAPRPGFFQHTHDDERSTVIENALAVDAKRLRDVTSATADIALRDDEEDTS